MNKVENNTINSVFIFDEIIKTMTVEALIDGMTKIRLKLETENDTHHSKIDMNTYNLIDDDLYSIQGLEAELKESFRAVIN